MNSPRQYEYKPGWMAILFGGIFFTVCGGMLTKVALTNQQGLLINRVIELGPAAATVFYWVLAACSFTFVLISAALAYVRMTSFHRIQLTDDAIVAPRSVWTSRDTVIPYNAIANINEQVVSGQRFLNIFPANGKKLMITASFMPSKADFAELRELLCENIASVRQDPPVEAEQPVH